VGTSWPGGVIWGYPGGSADPTDCNKAKPQADLAEFTINGFSNQDSYDISIVVCPSSPHAPFKRLFYQFKCLFPIRVL
jgi:hypothetical protein